MMPLFAAAALLSPGSPAITFDSLLDEMTSRSSLARWPFPMYESLQATSYNRESTKRDAPGWFADSDGTGFIRKQGDEFVLMEHTGPGVITKIWTPFFFYDFNERKGPNVRIYVDGSTTPVIDESLIDLVCGKGSIQGPWAAYSARAGNLILPIPFGKSVRITMPKPPFYFSVNYRAYPNGTPVESFTQQSPSRHRRALEAAAKALAPTKAPTDIAEKTIPAGASLTIKLPKGARAIHDLQLAMPEAVSNPEILRSTVLSGRFDGEETIWCPIGDFFCSADAVHPFQTWMRSVDSRGGMSSRWVMPYKSTGEISLTNLSSKPIKLSCRVVTEDWKWDDRSMHFHTSWRPDDMVPGTPFTDWNFVDIQGKGVYVGDAWTVLNIRKDSWWGEGDEKIYVDGAWEKGFPTNFGTGTEDYYGWAGGVYPVIEDQFSAPFLANVKVGGLDGHTLGYNICTRTRGLDAIPFREKLRFDMESSFGTDMREKWDLLGYSSVAVWYAMPGASSNRGAETASARKPIMSVGDLERESRRIKATG
jgi:hypothetical protein